MSPALPIPSLPRSRKPSPVGVRTKNKAPASSLDHHADSVDSDWRLDSEVFGIVIKNIVTVGTGNKYPISRLPFET